MSFIRLPYRYQMRGFTAAECASKNEVLLDREWCEETDTGRAKQGDGETPWNDLPYAAPGFIDFSALADGYAITWDAASGMLVFAPVASGLSTTNDLAEGTTNKYFTDERAQDAVAAMIAAGTHSNITFTYDDANNKISASVVTGGIDPHTTAYKHDDFENFGSADGWTVQNSAGSAAQITTGLIAGRPGIVSLSTGTNTAGVGSMLDSQVKYLNLGGGTYWVEYGFQLPTLSNATDRYSVLLGLRDVGFGTSTDDLVLVYSDNINSGNWVMRGTVGGVTTDTNAASGPTAGTWYRLRIEVNAAGTLATFYINGTSIGTTSAVSTASLRRMARIGKSAGTSARNMLVDFSTYSYTLTTSR